ncbi:hypothetical protein G7Y89_g9555 [Cudoniella acicularis]|uniref:FAD-binding PCMH-type domain-containing protein n=1 Tax=Cudoniella acicularis TaxID=354080 RepID=A0A8H4REF0_9HELO|nr:hypothetical protein G7Y89_g9555 [Cudoniella acicularis]
MGVFKKGPRNPFALASKVWLSNLYSVFRPYSSGKILTGMVALQDESFHKMLRQPFASIYSARAISAVEHHVDSSVQALLSKLREFASRAETFDFGFWMQLFVFDALCEVTFSQRLGFIEQGDDVDNMLQLVWQQFHDGAPISQMPWTDYIWRKNPLIMRLWPNFRMTPIVPFALGEIKKRKDEISKEGKGASMQDILSRFIEAQEATPSVPEWALITWTLGGIGAGGDTSVNIIRALFHNLLTHPDTLEKLRGELAMGMSEKYDKLTWKDAKSLPYLSACILEATRIHPSIGLHLERITPKEGVTLSGTYIPAGTVVGANAWVINRDPTVFGIDADSWNPGRWLNQDEAIRMRMTQTLFSFGAGHRMCPGRNLFEMICVKLLLAVIDEFELHLPTSAQHLAVENSWLLKQTGFHIRLRWSATSKIAASDEAKIRRLLAPDEIITPESDSFATWATCWAANLDRHPSLVLQPKSLPALQRIVKFLYESSLDFAIHSTGTGSSSARDIILSMAHFNEVCFNAEQETVILGAGQKWENVYRKLEQQAPGYALVGARQSYVSVAGTILTGGLSWLSGEFGLMSDPTNFLDAQLVLKDGRHMWASEDPELLWSLRGGGGNFGVMSAVKVKTFPYPRTFYAGLVIYPQTSLVAVSRALADFVNSNRDPRAVCHAFVVRPKALFFKAPYLGVGLFIFDGHGREHAESQVGFKWAFEIEGAQNMTAEMTFSQLGGFSARDEAIVKGQTRASMSGSIMLDVDAQMLVRASKWLDDVIFANPAFEEGSYVILETLQERTFNTVTSAEDTAWPHGFKGHVLQLAVGTQLNHPFPGELASTLVQQGVREIAPGCREGDYLPSFVADGALVEKVYNP